MAAGEERAPAHCPGVTRLHPAADGGLARVRVPGGRIGPEGLRAVAGASRLGNGIVELTSRAGLQIRGIPEERTGELAAVLAAGGLLPAPAHERVRNILASPLGGRGRGARAEIDGLVDALDRGLVARPELAELSERFLFAVDDGSGDVARRGADIVITATAADRFTVRAAGAPAAAELGAADAVAVALALARRALDGERRGSAPGPSAVPARPAAAAALRPGTARQQDGRRAITALAPLGRIPRDGLALLAGAGVTARLGPARTVSVVDVAAGDAERISGLLAGAGLVVTPETGWSGLSACAGEGACARALADVRGLAARRAVARGADSPAEHWAGCTRGCGRPAGVAVSVTASGAGFAVAFGDGEPFAAPDADAALRRLAPWGAVAHA